MAAPSYPLFQAFHSEQSETAALAVLRSGQIAAGPRVGEFQQALGHWLGQPHLVTTSDMSSAMVLALHLAGVRAGDEVLTAAYTCMSSAAPIANLGARPRWVDVEPLTGLMNPADVEARITPATRACVLYHAAGYPARTDEIAAVCRHRGIALIEDCNNALGATLNGAPVGQQGDSAVFGFYPNRQINAGDGGAVALRTAEQALRATRLRRFGIPTHGFRDADGEIDPHCDVVEAGWSAALNQLNSALGLEQLPGLADRLAGTRRNARQLAAALHGLPGLQLVAATPGAEPVYWGLMVLAHQRDSLLRALKRRGVMASRLHHRLDTYSGLRAEPAALPGTDAFFSRVLALPCGYWLDDNALLQIAAHVADALQEANG